MPSPYLSAVSAECRVVTLTCEDIGHGWHVTVHVEPRTGRGKKRALMQRVDSYHVFVPYRVDSRDTVSELLAECVLQRRLPGID